MAINPSKSSRFETLPTEISRSIIDLFAFWEVKRLSCASKSVREACLLSLFRCIEIAFSDDGFNGLKSLIELDTRYYIVSFTYVVPELLKAEIYDAGGEADEYPLYMRSIVDTGVDLSVLSLTFGLLPRLADVRLSFCEAIEDDSSLWPFTTEMTTRVDSYEHYVRVVSHAIRSSRNRGAVIRTISLSRLDLPYYSTWKVPDLSSLLESLRKLLESVKLDMCRMVAKHNALEDFLEMNKRYIRCIGFHDVKVTGSSPLESNLSELSLSMLYKMLKVL
ncbi:hypothetical protein BKA61DRAFT_721020 [Leptodontidium sp. MPI-SDFR-AT-0119]|nr:hypothetical protein BKA61DRAFT_721020 [Leptodontidium sp. MPI-SDFR-AT-0119]